MKNAKNKNVLKWIGEVIGRSFGWIGILGALHIAGAVLALTFAFSLRAVIDGATLGERDVFIKQFALLVLLILAMVTINALSRYIDERAKSTLEKRFRRRGFSELLHRSYGEVNAVHSGEWINRLTSDVTVIVNAAVQLIPGLLGIAVRMIGAISALVILIPEALWIIIPAGLVITVMSFLLRKKLKSYHTAVQESDGIVRSFMQERLGNLALIKTFTHEAKTVEIADEKMDGHVRSRMRRVHFSNICNIAMNLAMRGVYVFGVGLCGYKILRGEMSYGTMMAVLSLVNQAEAPFSQISGYLPQFYSMIASAERLMEIEKITSDLEISKEAEGVEDFGAVGLCGASFSYDSENRVLQNFDIEIKRGEYVALVGESGCGKSTVMKLLMSLYSLDGGESYLRLKNGDTVALTPAQRRLFAYVPQGNCLMNGSIREEISFSDGDIMKNDEKLRAALVAACAEFVYELPNGLDSPLGEQGSGLSEGQLQRLAIARALLSERPILLLDEATSALDGETERTLLANLRAMTDRTVLIITHRPAALDVCDRRVNFERL